MQKKIVRKTRNQLKGKVADSPNSGVSPEGSPRAPNKGLTQFAKPTTLDMRGAESQRDRPQSPQEQIDNLFGSYSLTDRSSPSGTLGEEEGKHEVASISDQYSCEKLPSNNKPNRQLKMVKQSRSGDLSSAQGSYNDTASLGSYGKETSPRLLLSQIQRDMLEEEFEREMDWSKEKRMNIAAQMNIPYKKIYKWWWDKRNEVLKKRTANGKQSPNDVI